MNKKLNITPYVLGIVGSLILLVINGLMLYVLLAFSGLAQGAFNGIIALFSTDMVLLLAAFIINIILISLAKNNSSAKKNIILSIINLILYIAIVAFVLYNVITAESFSITNVLVICGALLIVLSAAFLIKNLLVIKSVKAENEANMENDLKNSLQDSVNDINTNNNI